MKKTAAVISQNKQASTAMLMPFGNQCKVQYVIGV